MRMTRRIIPISPAESWDLHADGYKVLFEDGIFCEFAVFEARELAHIPFARGRLIWKDDSFDEKLCIPTPQQQSIHHIEGIDAWHLGEALTNLYVGLGRVQRGEKLTGTRFIQSYAVDHVLALAKALETAQGHTEIPLTMSADTSYVIHEQLNTYQHLSRAMSTMLDLPLQS